MHKINGDKADAHRHSTKLWWLDAEMLCGFWGKSSAGPLWLLGVWPACVMACCKTDTEC